MEDKSKLSMCEEAKTKIMKSRVSCARKHPLSSCVPIQICVVQGLLYVEGSSHICHNKS